MKIQGARIDAFVDKPDRSCKIFLFYGPDEGMNRIRAQKIIKARLGDKPDPFALIEFKSDELKEDPARLVDEALSLTMGGGDKIIYVREAQDFLTSALQEIESQNPSGCIVLVEAGELPPKSLLRQFAEESEIAAALPAYTDEGINLEKFARAELQQAGVQFSTDTLKLLTSLLSGNREINRREIDKILLYLGDDKTLTEENVLDCLIAQTALDLDDIGYAALSGDAERLLAAIAALKSEGMSGVALLRAASRLVQRAYTIKVQVEKGASLDSAIDSLRPPIFFKVKDKFRQICQRWPKGHLQRASLHLQQAELRFKSTGYPGDEIVAQCLLTICAQGRSLSRRSA